MKDGASAAIRRADGVTALACAFGAVAIAAIFSGQALRKGQVIKQFFAYSISESLARDPRGWLATRLPCVPPRVWVEEPPLFHFLAGWGIRVWPGFPAFWPLLSFFALVAVLGLWVREIRPGRAAHLAMVAACAFCPVFLRYSIQHLPDLFATAWLVAGAYAIWRGRSRSGICLFLIAVTAKALTLFAVLPILAWAWWTGGRSPRAARGWLAAAILIGAPFALWLAWIRARGVPSPFVFHTLVENRHSGNLALLVSPHYWLRFLTWNAQKGVGPLLFAGAVIQIFRTVRARPGGEWLAGRDGFLIFWAAGLVPYWILVRQGNLVHDYYALPFAAPLALLGARAALTLRRGPWLGGFLLALSVAGGLWNLARLAPVALPTGAERPSFCDMENPAASP